MPDSKIWPETQWWVPFGVQKGKGGFFEAQNDFMGRVNGASASNNPPLFDEGPVYDIPPHFDWSIPEKSMGEVSSLKNLSISYMALVKDKNALEYLYSSL